jgi:hypothetical protein
MFIFVIAMFISDSVKASANSLDFYYPSTGAAESYRADGSVGLKSNYVVYIHSNGAGYTIDNNKVRIESIKISNGTTTKTITSGFSYKNVSDYNSLDRVAYGNLPTSKLQEITIDLKNAITLPGSSFDNELDIQINLQQGKFFFVHTGWEAYNHSAVYSYVGGVKQSSNLV